MLLVGERLGARLKQPVIVDNRPGANAILLEPAMRGRLEVDGSAVRPNTPAQFGDFVGKEIAKYKGLVKVTGIHAE